MKEGNYIEAPKHQPMGGKVAAIICGILLAIAVTYTALNMQHFIHV